MPVRTRGKTYQLPESWADLLEHGQYLRFVLSLLVAGYTGQEVRLRFVMYVLDLPHTMWFRVKSEDGARLAEIVKFLLEPPPPLAFNPTPRLGRFFPPRKLWKDLTVWEYAQAEKFFRAYINGHDTGDLDKFLAVLFRPRRCAWWARTGDVRIPYNDDDVPTRARKLASKRMALKLGYLLHFLHFRTEIVELHPHLHGGKGAGLTPAQAAMQWADTIIALAQPGVEEQVAKASLAYTLRRLEMKAKEVDDLNEKNKPDANS